MHRLCPVRPPSTPNACGVCQCITFTFYVVPCTWFNGKWVSFFLCSVLHWCVWINGQLLNHKSVRMSVCILFGFRAGFRLRVFVFLFSFRISFIHSIRVESLQHFHANFDAIHCHWRWRLSWMYILCILKLAVNILKLFKLSTVYMFYGRWCLFWWVRMRILPFRFEQKRRHTLHKERTQIGHTFDT